jgi:hypothetical protein
MSDTSKLDDWTIEKLKEFAGKMMGQVKVTKTTKKEDSGGSYKNVSPEIENEDIPF